MNPPQKISEIGEFGLIERIKKIIPDANRDDIILGIGDDTAVIKLTPKKWLLATCDIQIEDSDYIPVRTDRIICERSRQENAGGVIVVGETCPHGSYIIVDRELGGNIEGDRLDDAVLQHRVECFKDQIAANVVNVAAGPFQPVQHCVKVLVLAGRGLRRRAQAHKQRRQAGDEP